MNKFLQVIANESFIYLYSVHILYLVTALDIKWRENIDNEAILFRAKNLF